MKRLDRSMVAGICRRLADQIEKDGTPTVIVSIRTGGDEIGRLLSGVLGCPVVEVYIARPDRTKVYEWIARISRIMAKIVYEALFLFDRPCVYASPDIQHGADVLLVDDAIQSGKTIRLARWWVKQFLPKRVRVATITDMRWRSDSDYYEYRSLVSFPWSKNSKEKGEKISKRTFPIPVDKVW